MTNIFIPSLYVLSGICLFTAVHHGLIAIRHPRERSNTLFACLSFLVMIYIIAKAGAYQAESGQEIIYMRRWETCLASIILGILPWFLSLYTGLRVTWLLVITSLLFGINFAASLLLPYGMLYSKLPEFSYFILPWGEQVADLRKVEPTGWYIVNWVGVFLVFSYGFYLCFLLYKKGIHRKSYILGLALGVFFAAVMLNMFINLYLLNFTHTAEFGFLALVIVMSLAITRGMQENEWRIGALLNNIPAVIYTKDTQGKYQFINHRFEKLFHISNDEAVGKTDYDLFPAEQASEFRNEDREVLESCKTMQFDEVATIDGVRHEYVTIKFPVLDPEDIPIAVCSVSTDVTEMRKAKEELNLLRRQIWHADRVLRTGVLTASLAHELSQPLAAILCNAQAGLRFLNNRNPELSEIHEILNDIARDDKRAATIINGLRAMLRQQETQREQLDVRACIDELLTLMHTEFIEHHVQCKSMLDPGCIILADRVQIQQVVLNLLVNAIEAMKEQADTGGRHLLISASRFSDNEIRVAVRDSGIGIPPDKIGKIFDGYYTTKDKGLGIGLAMCRAIIESHSGRIWVECHDGPGVTVSLALPRFATDSSVNQTDG